MKKNQLKQIILGFAVAGLILAGLAAVSWPKGERNQATVAPSGESGALRAEEKLFDFGQISMANGKMSHSFGLKNTGSETIIIGKIYTSCMCTTAGLDVKGKKFGPYGMPGHGFIPTIGEAIAPGGEAKVEVVFDPAAHGPAGVGTVERIVYIEHSGGNPLELAIRAVVTP